MRILGVFFRYVYVFSPETAITLSITAIFAYPAHVWSINCPAKYHKQKIEPRHIVLRSLPVNSSTDSIEFYATIGDQSSVYRVPSTIKVYSGDTTLFFSLVDALQKVMSLLHKCMSGILKIFVDGKYASFEVDGMDSATWTYFAGAASIAETYLNGKNTMWKAWYSSGKTYEWCLMTWEDARDLWPIESRYITAAADQACRIVKCAIDDKCWEPR